MSSEMVVKSCLAFKFRYVFGTALKSRLTFKVFLAILQLSNLFDPKNLYPRKRLLQHMYFTDYRQNLFGPRKNKFLTGRLANFAQKSKSSGCKTFE